MSGCISKQVGRVLGLLILLALWSCSGGNSANNDTEDPPLVAQSFNEQCALCHRSGSIAPVADEHSTPSAGLQGEITDVTIDGATGAVTIAFSLFDSENNLIPVAGVTKDNIRFTLAKLVVDVNGVSDWQSYINTTEVKTADKPGSAPDGNTEVQATAQRTNASGGSFVDLGNGSYTYTMSIDIRAVATPVAVTYEPALTHRVAMQVSGNASNAVFDFVPDGSAVTATRKIVDNTSCNACHIQLALHGGGRIQTDYCVTCHNPGSADANSGNTVDFKVMIHKIHAGELLPVVDAGGEYAIWGNSDNKHTYSTVVYPQELNNCTKCHDGGDANTPDGDNWKNTPTLATCTSCHDAPDAAEFPTFPDLTPVQIEEAHQIPAQLAAARYEFNIVSITSTNPGEQPVVTFSVTDPTNADLPYDILNDAPFTAAGGASRLAVLIGWPTAAYTNTGSESVPAQPVSINPLGAGTATDNGDGTYTVVSPVAIPLTVTGSGTVAIEGHPAGDFNNDGVFNDRVPVTNVAQAFAITDATAQARAMIGDIADCKQCHGVLSLHGNNRTDNLQVCVICHNADATDIDVRPPAAQAADGLAERAIDFKSMIHAIHAGDADFYGFREEGIVVYGFGGSVNDFSQVRLPSALENLKNCAGCHTNGSFGIPISDDSLPTTVSTGVNLSSPDDDRNVTPTAAVCSACHDSLDAKTHMSEKGAKFDFVPFAPEPTAGGGGPETQLCGPGPVSAQPAGHSSRTDCCSCHGFQ